MGIKLSGGQKQRLLIARELYREPEILILMKQLVVLMRQLNLEISSSITKLSKSLTVVIVAHRPNSVKNSDYLIVLKNGKIVEKGNYTNLMQSKTSFLHEMKL